MKRHRESGAALLTVLLIVAALSAISVAMLDDMRRGIRLDANISSVTQAQWYAIGADAFARSVADDLQKGLYGRSALAGEARTATFPLDGGRMDIRVRDASTCINLNSVVVGAGEVYEPNAGGAAQLHALMVAADISSAQAADLTDALSAWLDTGGSSGVDADDSPYLVQSPPYMTAGQPMTEVSELRAIRGFTPEVYDKLHPFVCALPVMGRSVVNLNALAVEQAPVLVALTGGKLTERDAVDLIAARPAGGWTSLGEFWGQPVLAALSIPTEAFDSGVLDTRFLNLDVQVNYLDAEVTMSELLVFKNTGFAAASRRWGDAP
ncbi:MAG: type II secretion system minor pseudopilin GspK [Alphaproteobacteria bacterium]|nr:type II secretion system minor pseudopilin GspK [Alphaproteobacteria bacterium]